MDWIQFAVMFVTFVGLFIWNRTEARADIRHMDTKLESNRSLSLTIHKETQDTIRAMQEAIQLEIKDFHGRLERQDAEFKGKLALQDAEFKAHLMYLHSEGKK